MNRVRLARDPGSKSFMSAMREIPIRIAGLCGVLAVLTFNVGWIAGDLAQRAAFSPANDDISHLGASTASRPWLYNQVAANLTGLLIVALGVGLWMALSPSRLGRLGAAALMAAGIGTFLDGLFRLDCQPIDPGCTNDSWHAHAHKIESGFTVGATFLALLILALAFRRTQSWHGAWLPVLAALPGVVIANVAFSALGAGAATRAGTVFVFAVIGFLGLRLLRQTRRDGCGVRMTS
jgi:Protein of unknown function (DUF998)